MARMDTKTACNYVMPIGKYRGKTIARIGARDEGLRYLDWLVQKEDIGGQLREAMETYLGDPDVARILSGIIGS
jgi:uncharacterized protein (DUF3820 family)